MVERLGTVENQEEEALEKKLSLLYRESIVYFDSALESAYRAGHHPEEIAKCGFEYDDGYYLTLKYEKETPHWFHLFNIKTQNEHHIIDIVIPVDTEEQNRAFGNIDKTIKLSISKEDSPDHHIQSKITHHSIWWHFAPFRKYLTNTRTTSTHKFQKTIEYLQNHLGVYTDKMYIYKHNPQYRESDEKKHKYLRTAIDFPRELVDEKRQYYAQFLDKN